MQFTRFPARSALAMALALLSAPAFAQSEYSRTVFIGDSLSDSGAFRPGLVQAAGPDAAILGRFTTNPGWVWSEYVARYYGTDATSANQGGDNYAVGGARLTQDRTGPFGPVPSLGTQLGAYLGANGGSADANALYSVWGGANDLFAVAAGEESTDTIGAAVGAEVQVVGALQQAGARYVLVPNIPDLGKTPQFLVQGAAASAAGTQLASAFNDALYGGLEAAGLRVIPLNTFGFLNEIIADPGRYGFANATAPACTVESSLTCNPLTLVDPSAAQNYVFADGVHPTTRAHEILSQYALSVLEGPRQIALLTHSATVTGRSRAERVAAHVGARPEADGVRWWGSLRGDNQRYGHGDVYDGTVPAGLFGVDWSRGDWVYGGFAGYGHGKQDFGHRGGEFTQSDTTLGGFAGWYGDNAWVNAQLSYTWLGYEVKRDVQLGPATNRHTGSPDGSNLSAAIDAGFEFGQNALRQGPVASLLWQKVKLDGYTESNPDSTALAFPDQDLDSLIGSAGWQFSYTLNESVRPYLRATYDHEFKKAPGEVFAQLQSIPGLAPYAVPGLAQDRDYGTVLLGARTHVFGLDADIGASRVVGRTGGNDTTVFVTLGGAF